jgi:hypothetical protein
MRTLRAAARVVVLAWLGSGWLALGSSASVAWAAQTPPASPQSAPAATAVSEAATAPFSAPLAPPYPDANDPAAMGRWFGQTTHLPAKSILAVTDNAIFAAFPHHESGPYWTVDVRLESITPQSTDKLGGRSIHLRLNVRCDNDTVRLNFLDVYPGADLTGAPTHRAPPNTWAVPKPNSYVADAVRLACDKTFQGPFAAIAAAAPSRASDPRPQARAPERAPETPERPSERPPERPSLQSGYAVQIGAFSSIAATDAAWEALKADMPAATGGLSKAIRPIEIQGRPLYRTIIHGFPSSAAAASFCQTLQTAGRPCLTLGGGRP